MRMGAAVCGLRLLGLLVSLLALLLALPAGAAAESYNESLRLRALPGGRVHATFAFELASDAASLHHFRVLPRALVQPVASLGVHELQLSLNAGRWQYAQWGTPAPAPGGGDDEAVASGAEAWALLDNTTSPSPAERWQVLTSALASQFCVSLDAFAHDGYATPHYDYFSSTPSQDTHLLHAYLPSEAVCTENLSPLLALLPCKGGAGLASLIQAHTVAGAEFHGISVSVRRGEHGWRVRLGVQAVMQGGDSWTLSSLFRRELSAACPMATQSTIEVLGPPRMAVSGAGGPAEPREDPWDEEEEPPQATRHVVHTDELLASGTGLTASTVGAPVEVAQPPLLATRALLGYGQERNVVRLTLRNQLPHETVHMMYYDQLPWFAQPLLHTVQAEAAVDEFDEADDVVRYRDDVAPTFIVSAHYMPPARRRRPSVLELELRVPAASTLTVTYTLVKQVLHYDEHVPDPHRGLDLPPPMFVPLVRPLVEHERRPRTWAAAHAKSPAAVAQPARMYAAPTLLDMAVPDFSMPYNVILFYSTFVALFFGSMLNVMVRIFRDVYVEQKRHAR